MAAEQFDQRLTEIETLQAELQALLATGAAPAIAPQAAALRLAMLALAHAAAEHPPIDATRRQRLQNVAHGLARQREHLARHAVLVERGLAVLVPQASPTYEAPGRAGAFRGSAPRLYAAAG